MEIEKYNCSLTLENGDIINIGDRVRAKGKNNRPYFTATVFNILTGFVLDTENPLDNIEIQFSEAQVDGESGTQFLELFLFELEDLTLDVEVN